MSSNNKISRHRKFQPRLPKFIFSLSVLPFIYSKLYSISAEPIVDLPTRCESCVLFAREFEDLLSSDKKVGAAEKELRFLESIENFCLRMLKYKLHKEKSGTARFAKEESSTMKALNELRNKGVKVELGMPYEMWDSPSVEVVTLKQNCETLLEQYEDDLEQWYNLRDRPSLEEYLCEKRVLKRAERTCMGNSDHMEL